MLDLWIVAGMYFIGAFVMLIGLACGFDDPRDIYME